MSNSVFNTNKIDFSKQFLFFGEGRNVQEYIKPMYPQFTELDLEMEGFFWGPTEIGLINDRNDYKKMDSGAQFIYTKNLQYQILLDSIQGRSPLLTILPAVTNPELESCIITWGFFEKIHSKSYTHIIKNLYSDPSEIVDAVLDIPQIIARAKSIGESYDALLKLVNQWMIDRSSVDQFELHLALYKVLISVNALEGIRFYVSFACNFAFERNKQMLKSGSIMGLIARDESLHLSLTQKILKIIHSGKDNPIWEQVIAYCVKHGIVEAIFRSTAEQEKDWATYLFQNGSVLGLTEGVLHQYIDHVTNKRMRAIGFTPIFPNTSNPMTWLESRLNSKGVQEAPQEVEKESYQIGRINTNVSDDDFSDFDF